MQGDTHEETPFYACSMVDRAPGLLAEAGMGFSMVKEEVR